MEKVPMDIQQISDLISTSPKYLYIKKTLRQISLSFKLYDLENLFISYSGGKDAEVVLQLVRIALYQRSLNTQQQEDPQKTSSKDWEKIKIVLFEEDNSIPEVNTFVQEQAQRFNFSPIIMGKDVKKETFKLVDNHQMKAIFLGNRRVDPYSGISPFILKKKITHEIPANIEVYSPSDSDKGWAAFMRIHPIIDWNYDQVWIFLKDFNIPYCPLYDKGYTHLGNITNSGPNEFLKQQDGQYLPAHQADGKYEHFSRKGCKTSPHLSTKHFLIVYKDIMSDILEMIKTITVLLGNSSHISVIELNALNKFIAKTEEQDVTIVYDKLKITKDELSSFVETYKILEISEVGK